MKRRRLAFLLGTFWPGLGQLSVDRVKAGFGMALGALGLACLSIIGWRDPAGLLGRASGPALLGWLLLWAVGIGDLLAILVLGPARRERAARLLKAGIVYLLRGDLSRASESLERAAALGGTAAAFLYLVESERGQGKTGRAARRLESLAGAPRAAGWQWEIDRLRLSNS